jgi:hypothetical protein
MLAADTQVILLLCANFGQNRPTLALDLERV